MLFIGASSELGTIESGAVAAWIGALPSVVLGGVGTPAVGGSLDALVLLPAENRLHAAMRSALY
jgi:hypothetical protein